MCKVNVNHRVCLSVFLSFALLISFIATASAAKPGLAKDPDGKGSQGKLVAHATPIVFDGSVSKSLDFGTNESAAKCTADCGDGSGWECTGDYVECEDGVGCYAEGNDGSFAGGSCQN